MCDHCTDCLLVILAGSTSRPTGTPTLPYQFLQQAADRLLTAGWFAAFIKDDATHPGSILSMSCNIGIRNIRQ